MSKTITVHVIQADIDAGVRNGECPLALALRDAGYPTARVGLASWTPQGVDFEQNDRLWAPLPWVAQYFIARLNAGKPVAPATFRLRLPEEAS